MLKNRFFAMALYLIVAGANVLAQNPGGNGGRPPRGMFPMNGGMPPMNGMMPPGGMGGPMMVGMPMFGALDGFGVEFATEVPEEKDVVVKSKSDTLYNYYVENVKFGKPAKVNFDGDNVAWSGFGDVDVKVDGAYVAITSSSVEPIAIELSGKTENGSLKLNVGGPLKLVLNGVVIKSQRGEAILVESTEHVYAVLAEGSKNELSDCRNPEMPPMMGMPPMGMDGMPEFKPGEMPMMPMPFMGSREDEKPEDYHVQYGIRMKKAKPKEKLKLDGTFVCAGPLTLSGKGSLSVLSNNKVGLKSKASLMLRPGNNIMVKAMSGKGVNAKNEVYMFGGVLNVDCSFSADKALTSGRNMYIRGGHVVVKAGGGEASEGVESKFLMQIDGGVVEVVAQDDAINSQGDLVVNGGKVSAYSLSNDAIDSNCNIVVNGGDVFASGYGMPEGGLDCADEEGYRLYVNGGTIVAVGGRHSMPEKQSRQASVQWRLENLEEGKTYGIADVCTYKSNRVYQMGGASIMFSSPKLQKGKAYNLTIDGKEVERIESLTAPVSSVGNMRWPM